MTALLEYGGLKATVTDLVWTGPTAADTQFLNYFWIGVEDLLSTSAPDRDYEAAKIMADLFQGKAKLVSETPTESLPENVVF